MGKSKQRGKKQQDVFQVANRQTKSKTKTKPVKTSLKHMNTLKNEKGENLNQIVTEVQRDVKCPSKSTSCEPKGERKVVTEAPEEAVNMDDATQSISQH